MNMEGNLLTTREVADRLGVTPRTVRKLCEQRKIKYMQTTPRRIHIREEWLKEYLDSVTHQSISKGDKNND